MDVNLGIRLELSISVHITRRDWLYKIENSRLMHDIFTIGNSAFRKAPRKLK